MTVTHQRKYLCFWSYINGPYFSVFHSLCSDTGKERGALFLNAFVVDLGFFGKYNVCKTLMVKEKSSVSRRAYGTTCSLGLAAIVCEKGWELMSISDIGYRNL